MTDLQSTSTSTGTIDALSRALRDGRLTINTLEDNSGVLLDLEREQLMTLNATGMCVVQAVEAGGATRDALADALVRRFEVVPEAARCDVDAFLRELDRALAG